MSTACATRIFEDGECLVNMVRQADGYPEGHGQELFEFLSSKKITCGITNYSSETEANGLSCLAAQMIAHFKKGIGGIYLQMPRWPQYEYEFTYDVFGDSDSMLSKVVVHDDQLEVFSGSVEAFGVWLNLRKEQAA